MPDYLRCDDRLFEVIVLAEARGDCLARVELFEMGPEGGLLGIISDWPGRDLEMELFGAVTVPVPVIEWWIRLAAG